MTAAGKAREALSRWRNGRSASRARQAEFEQIYRENAWLGIESRSGPGSDLSHTEAIRDALPRLIREFSIQSLLDCPCGDFFWMQRVPLDGVTYIGLDIVDEIIQRNRRTFASASRRFERRDAVREAMPRADLVLSRDFLVHLSFDDAWAALANITGSGARLFLATTFDELDENEDIATGRWRPLNLTRPPFNFPAPLEMVYERRMRTTGRDKALGLWRMADLPVR